MRITWGVYTCKWTRVRASGFWLHREGEMADGTGEKGANFGKGYFVSLRGTQGVPSVQKCDTWRCGGNTSHVSVALFFLDNSPTPREGRRSRVGVTKRKVMTEEEKTRVWVFCDSSRCWSPPSPPLWWQRPTGCLLCGEATPLLWALVLLAELVPALRSRSETQPG